MTAKGKGTQDELGDGWCLMKRTSVFQEREVFSEPSFSERTSRWNPRWKGVYF